MTTEQARAELAQYDGNGAPRVWEAARYAKQVTFYRTILRLLRADGKPYRELMALWCIPPRPAHLHPGGTPCPLCYPRFPTHLDALGPGLYPAFKRTIERRP